MKEKAYRSLYLIRRAEEEVEKIYPSDKIKSPVHLSIGQEAVSVGVCMALQARDAVFGTYRSHALYLAKGGDLKGFFAELYGKVTGCTKGKGGSMHLIDTACGMMGSSAIVASTIPHAVGYAYALKYRKSKSVAVSFFGDGAVDEGVFHESVNFAALKKLPVIFICENNLYAIHSHYLTRHAKDGICQRIRTYGIKAERIGDNDTESIHRRVAQAVKAIRRGGSGPYFFECMTYRWRAHVGPGEDFALGYRDKAECAKWSKRDDLERLGRKIGLSRRRRIEQQVEAQIKEAIRFAERSPFPRKPVCYEDMFA